MGVVKRQSIKTTIVLYIGMAFGYLNMGVLFPLILSNEEIGLISTLVAGGSMIGILAQFGMSTSLVRFWPFMEKEDQKARFLSFALLVPLLVSSILALLLWLLKEPIVHYWYEDNALVSEFYLAVIPFAISMAYMAVFSGYARTFFRITVPNIIQRVIIRMMNAVALFTLFYSFISYPQFVWIFVGISILGMLLIGGYVKYVGKAKLRFSIPLLDADKKGAVLKYSGFSLLTYLGDILSNHIDVMMIGPIISLEAAGIYKIGFFIGAIIDIPMRSLGQISAPVYANAWRNNDRKGIFQLYQKSSSGLLLIGVLIFAGIWVNLDRFFEIMPRGDDFAIAKWVIFWIAIGKLFRMLLGTNNQLLNNSKYYLVNSFSVIGFAVLIVISNFILIPMYGITGAALATASSIVVLNLFKFFFIWIKLNMQPFTLNTLLILGIGALVLLIGFWFPALSNPFVDIAVRSLIVLAAFSGLVLLTGVSEDATKIFKKILGR